jgi:hypothetical protein
MHGIDLTWLPKVPTWVENFVALTAEPAKRLR